MSTIAPDGTSRVGSQAVQPTVNEEVLNALDTYRKKDTNKSESLKSPVTRPSKSLTRTSSHCSVQGCWKCTDYETKHVQDLCSEPISSCHPISEKRVELAGGGTVGMFSFTISHVPFLIENPGFRHSSSISTLRFRLHLMTPYSTSIK